MKTKQLLALLLFGLCLVSCKSYESVPYFQDLNDPANLPVLKASDNVLKLGPADKLNIVVSSALSPEIATSFNLPLQSNRIGAAGVSAGSSYSTMPYLIDSKGDIDFPVVGKIRVAGMTREEVETTIKRILVDNKLLNDAVVTCEVLNQYVNVLGDVKNPGRILIEKDNLTIIEAIAKCGDLNITGERQSVMVIRQEGGEQKVYRVDLSNAQNVYSSPVYYLLPNDVIYVNPNVTKQRTSMPIGNSWQTPTLYLSLASFALSMAVMISNLVK